MPDRDTTTPGTSPGTPAPDPDWLAALREPGAPPSRRAASFRRLVRWVLEDQAWLVPRLYRCLRRQGLAGGLGPADVLHAFLLEAWDDPTTLGEAPEPSRTWLWWRIRRVLNRLASRGSPLGDPAPEVEQTREFEARLGAVLAQVLEDSPELHQVLVSSLRDPDAATREEELQPLRAELGVTLLEAGRGSR